VDKWDREYYFFNQSRREKESEKGKQMTEHATAHTKLQVKKKLVVAGLPSTCSFHAELLKKKGANFF
jgi:hypothetical protein